jgi:hypothetical protein
VKNAKISNTIYEINKLYICFNCNILISQKTKDFIGKAIKIHGDKYDYSLVEYYNNSTKIIIICEKHGEFKQIPNSHLLGHNCAKCSKITYSNKRRKPIQDFIAEAKKIHGDKYDYSSVKYKTALTKIIIICEKHGQFKQTPNSHLSGRNCPKCSKITASDKLRKPIEDFITEAIKIHGDKYDYSSVEYYNTRTNVVIICEKHGEFKQTPDKHLSGNNCPKCSIITCADKRRKPIEDFIAEAKEIHGDKYDYSLVEYKTTHTNVIIICEKHGEFKQAPSCHLSGNNCPKCSIITCADKRRKPIEDFIAEAKKIHGDKYDYSLVEYKRTDTNVVIICEKHGQFEQTPHSHLSGQNCPKCSIITASDKRRKPIEDFIAEAKKIHGDKYNYSLVEYKTTDTKVVIICEKHREYKQTPRSHLSGRNCPKCNLCPVCELWRTKGELCIYCLPKEKNKLYQKTKEYKIVKYLKDNLPNENFIHNKSIGAQCTLGEKEKSNGHLYPDIRFDCLSYQLIVEVDEHKHRGANYKCDEQRMYNIIAKLGQPCIFIRYNPDSKKSIPEKLLQKISLYLDIQHTEIQFICNKFGFKVDYLFY